MVRTFSVCYFHLDFFFIYSQFMFLSLSAGTLVSVNASFSKHPRAYPTLPHGKINTQLAKKL